jgi:hypothetical protein
LWKSEQALTDEEIGQVRKNLKLIGEEDFVLLCCGTATEVIDVVE